MLRRLQRMGIRRGFVAGSRPWLYIGIASWGIRKLRQLAEPNADILLSEPLRPGERIVISNARPTSDDV